jgi:xanthine dehydrogenase/oxidase
VEGIGSSVDGYHSIQKTVAEKNASQCGYCTPGFVMSMYSLLQQKNVLGKEQIEDNFDGNICRCTGYRPILDAMKSFANVRPEDVGDIEDLASKKPCFSSCMVDCETPRRQAVSGVVWYSPQSLPQVFEVLEQCKGKQVAVVCGGTGKGVFKYEDESDVIIDLKRITELWKREVTEKSVVVGACVSLTQLIDFLCQNKDKSSSFEELANHLQTIGNVAVRNCGSWAGNLMMKHKRPSFPSDLVTMMEAAGSTVTIATKEDNVHTYTLLDFLSLPMENKLIVSMEIPFLNKDERLRTFKVMPRAQNAHAYVNAGFRIKCDPASSSVIGIPSCVFGGISEHKIHAQEMETFLSGRFLKDQDTLQGALAVLEKELQPSGLSVEAVPEYRRSLACSLFYKFYLSCVGEEVDPQVKTAAENYIRPLSSGQQVFDEPSQSLQPVTLSVPKLSALQLTSGEAIFTTDIPHTPKELQGAFVLTSEGNATIVSVDPTDALSMPGVVTFVSAKDIPKKGVNNFLSPCGFSYPEQVFAADESLYAGQALGIIIADSHMHAVNAARKVKVVYKSLGPPILSIKDAIEKNSFFPDPDPLMMGDEG